MSSLSPSSLITPGRLLELWPGRSEPLPPRPAHVVHESVKASIRIHVRWLLLAIELCVLAPANRFIVSGRVLMSRHLTLLLCTLVVVAGCSRNPERSMAASPTAPSVSGLEPGSLLGPTSVAPGGVSGPMDVLVSAPQRLVRFPQPARGRNIKPGSAAGTSPTVVDKEGEVVWTQEYMRYRTNGCDHATADAAGADADRRQRGGRGLRRAAGRPGRVSASQRLARFPSHP